MARYRGPVEKIERRLDADLGLKGERRLSGKSALEKRPFAPGQHGQRRAKISEYGLQLREKQKAKFMYGVSEKQFRKYFKEAARVEGNTGANLITLLERRLDNVVYRLGFASTRRQARQLVNHGHFLVNGVKTDIPSYRVNIGDVIEVREKSLNLAVIKEALENKVATPAFVEVDTNKLTGKLTRLPERSELNSEINESLIVEYYNRLG